MGAVRMWIDRRGMVHVHSRHSDGRRTIGEIARAGGRAGVDFVIVTDHDTLAGREGGEGGWHDDTLVIVGQEITPPEGNHFLALGLDHVVSRRLLPQQYVDEVAAAGGLGFIAHPHYPEPKRYPLQTYPWQDWTVSGFTGIEIWNYTVDWLTDVTHVGRLALALLHPDRTVEGPDPRTLARWDKMLVSGWARGRRVVGLGGTDAHGILYSYRRMFKTVRTHVLLADEWSGDGAADEALVLDALQNGRAYVAYDALHDATGFQFTAEGGRGHRGQTVPMGGVFSLPAGGAWFTVRAPREGRITLRSPDRVVAQVEASEMEYRLTAPGVYRVEARLSGRGGWRPWVFTNPIYVR